MRLLIYILFICILLVSCKKEQPKPTYTVTYYFESSAPRCYVQIWDATNLNDSGDSISGSFSKTVVYDYAETWRCKITNRNNVASFKRITITYNSATTSKTDTLYPTVEFFRAP